MKIKNINKEINQLIRAGDKTPYETIRYKYLKEINGNFPQKIVLAYSCNFNNPEEIIEDDIKSFINLLDDDKSSAIVIILTSLGGDLTAVERIMTYLRDKYHDQIEFIIPQIAMSAGTVMSFCSKKIYMSSFSCLGPIDPQIKFANSVIPGHSIIKVFNDCRNDLAKNQNQLFWEMEMKKYPPAIEVAAQNGIKYSEKVAIKFLTEVMYKGVNPDVYIKDMVETLNSDAVLTHGQKILRNELSGFLKIDNLENNMQLYNSVMNYHHALSITFERAPQVTKIIETADAHSIVRQKNIMPNPQQIKQPTPNINPNLKAPLPHAPN